MRAEVVIWLLANALSFVVSARDLLSTWRVWRWSRKNLNGGEMMFVAKRNVRASLFRFALATSFISAGVIAVIPFGAGWTVWFLVAGALILTTDIVLESRYRGRMFSAAQKREAKERQDSHKEKATWHRRK